MSKKQNMQRIVHGRHAKKRSYTKCGMALNKFPDGNHTAVNTNAMGQINCVACRGANNPGVV